MIRVSEGKYRIGDTKMLIFVRVSWIYGIVLIFIKFFLPYNLMCTLRLGSFTMGFWLRFSTSKKKMFDNKKKREEDDARMR